MSETEANQVFELLVPVVERSPRAEDAVDAAAGVIGRCPLSDDRPLAHVLDWWFVATTGRPSANGGAHLLPESLDERVRTPMAAVAQLSVTVPAAEWLDKQRQLESRLKKLNDDLSLDKYGAVKLPGERVAWKWFTDQWRPATDELGEGRKAEVAAIDWKRPIRNCAPTVSKVEADGSGKCRSASARRTRSCVPLFRSNRTSSLGRGDPFQRLSRRFPTASSTPSDLWSRRCCDRSSAPRPLLKWMTPPSLRTSTLRPGEAMHGAATGWPAWRVPGARRLANGFRLGQVSRG